MCLGISWQMVMKLLFVFSSWRKTDSYGSEGML